MSKRFVIMGIQYGCENETELVAVDQNPEAMLAALDAKTLMVHTGGSSRRQSVKKYHGLRIVEREKA